uniref:Uncharacterized protein n=1 Tax=Romanomermis culicivorax TaxID=13658 RepID=A0A915JG43_ROMCU
MKVERMIFVVDRRSATLKNYGAFSLVEFSSTTLDHVFQLGLLWKMPENPLSVGKYKCNFLENDRSTVNSNRTERDENFLPFRYVPLIEFRFIPFRRIRQNLFKCRKTATFTSQDPSASKIDMVIDGKSTLAISTRAGFIKAT